MLNGDISDFRIQGGGCIAPAWLHKLAPASKARARHYDQEPEECACHYYRAA